MKKYQRQRAWLKRISSAFFVSIIITIVLLLTTIITWQLALRSLEDVKAEAAQQRETAFSGSLAFRLGFYEQLALSSVALFRTSNTVTIDDWQLYVNHLQEMNNITAARQFGYSKYVPASSPLTPAGVMARHGVERYNLRPAYEKPLFAPVIFMNAQDQNQAQRMVGYNLWSDPVMRGAMERARDTGEVQVSDADVFNRNQQNPSGIGSFLVFAPLYKQDQSLNSTQNRRAAIRGFAFVLIDGKALLGSVSQYTRTPGTLISVSGQFTGPIYTDKHFDRLAKQSYAHVTKQTLRLYGQQWHIRYAFDERQLVGSGTARQPTVILLVGLGMTLLISYVVYLLMRLRATELHQQQMRQINVAKDDLLSLVSHQLRTPITSIKQHLGMVLEGFAGKASGTQRQFIQEAYDSNERQLATVNEILQVARVESGRLVLEKSLTDMNQLLEEVVSEMEHKSRQNNQRLQVNKLKRTITIQADEHMLRTALNNVIGNAIKYTPKKGAVRVTMTATKENIRIRVKDNGIGIAEQDVERIFQKFQRLPEAEQHVADGSGVGLYLAQQLVAAHGGSIVVDSTIGQGSTFTVILPRNP